MWDHAAGVVCCREAGAVVSDLVVAAGGEEGTSNVGGGGANNAVRAACHFARLVFPFIITDGVAAKIGLNHLKKA